MAKGISINFGLNSVDPVHYQGWSGDLNACEFDAHDMARIAEASGFAVKKFLTEDATRDAILGAIGEAAAELTAGDLCLISYSGHGGQIPDLDGDEDDGLDETWCLYDGQLVDDEIYAALSAFAAGVRVLVFSDSCHSGSVTKDAAVLENLARGSRSETRSAFAGTYRAMPNDIMTRVFLANRAYYEEKLSKKGLAGAKAAVSAACLLISGCQDNQLSGDGPFNGVFTGRLKMVWNGGKFSGDHVAFWKEIRHHMPADQTPNFYAIGKGAEAFQKQRPFDIAGTKTGAKSKSAAAARAGRVRSGGMAG
jgi:hypothetical protein